MLYLCCWDKTGIFGNYRLTCFFLYVSYLLLFGLLSVFFMYICCLFLCLSYPLSVSYFSAGMCQNVHVGCHPYLETNKLVIKDSFVSYICDQNADRDLFTVTICLTSRCLIHSKQIQANSVKWWMVGSMEWDCWLNGIYSSHEN